MSGGYSQTHYSKAGLSNKALLTFDKIFKILDNILLFRNFFSRSFKIDIQII